MLSVRCKDGQLYVQLSEKSLLANNIGHGGIVKFRVRGPILGQVVPFGAVDDNLWPYRTPGEGLWHIRHKRERDRGQPLI